jgi:hypothetical protein
MLTALAIVALIVLSIGFISLLSSMFTGDLFAWLWFGLGGAAATLEIIGKLFVFALEICSSGND